MGAYLRSDKAAITADLERIYAMFSILAERQRQNAGTLSGGQQQMCAIGRGLMGRRRACEWSTNPASRSCSSSRT